VSDILRVTINDDAILDDILGRVAAEEARFKYHLQPPCPDDKLEEMKQQAREAFGVEVPDGYVRFLRRMNGLDFNGTLFFAAQKEPRVDKPSTFIEGFVDANLIRREYAENFLFFGESGMEMYAYNLDSSRYEVVDSVSLDAYESFGSYGELMTAALEKRLT
jgi:hypothetical protein